ncbi:MAG TPA: HAD-IIA family hydrolase [Fimbriimonas sp.]|nr:HAD-IIA family hydrolase [Fimbriimonas sp.]
MPYRAYIFDLDGTLFRGDEPIVEAVETVNELAQSGAMIRYLTNNSSRTREFFVEKLRKMGYPAEHEQVYTSGYGTAIYLHSQAIHRVFVVGEQGLIDTLSHHGIYHANEAVEAVVVGLNRSFNYDLMNEAMQLIRSGARFVATNPDTTYPREGGKLIPGAGSIVAAVTACSETEPFVVGKPNPYLVQLVLADAGLNAKDALVVGDRDDTDLESGRRAGCPTFLVLTGITQSPPDGQWHGHTMHELLKEL